MRCQAREFSAKRLREERVGFGVLASQEVIDIDFGCEYLQKQPFNTLREIFETCKSSFYIQLKYFTNHFPR